MSDAKARPKSPTRGRRRLVLSFFLVALLQLVVVGLGVLAVVELTRRGAERALVEEDRFVVNELVPRLERGEDISAIVKRGAGELGADIVVLDASGTVLASTTEAARRCEPGGPGGRNPPWVEPFGPRPPGPPPHPPDFDPGPHKGPPPGAPRELKPPTEALCRVVPLALPGGRYGKVEFRRERAPNLVAVVAVGVAVLAIMALSAAWLARSIVRPLRKLSRAAAELGRGNLTARADLGRADELGEVGRAFDEMATQLAELLRAEKELIANVSHELRTPLARIRVALDIASEGDADAVRESLGDITEDLAELERLVSDILTVAKLDLAEPGRDRAIPPLRREDIDLASLLEKAGSRLASTRPKRRVLTELEPDLPEVVGDAVLLRRAFDNLIDNADKYTEDAEAPIRIVARRRGKEVEVEVVDQGIGIASADLSGVFRPFYRVDRSRTRATGGLGLGLALVKRIIVAHGGTISIESSLGGGTCMRVRLPGKEPS
ncbi:MAG: HAMP domain-containing sensor histidine kinase [Polyangiaceae bacterium]